MDIKRIAWSNISNSRHNCPLLPKSIRGLIVGKSGCGKTTLLMNLLLQPGWLDYDKLQVFGKSLFQPEYKILHKGFQEKLPKELIMNLFDSQTIVNQQELSPLALLEEMGKKNCEKCNIQCDFYETSDVVPDPRELSYNDKNLMIFDDLQLEKQNMCEKYYIRGRHSNVDCFYLAQNYFKLPRQTIRENANFICLFPQDKKNIDHIYRDHASHDLSREDFMKLCKEAWKKPYNFLVIDLSSSKSNGRYRKNFDEFYFPNNI